MISYDPTVIREFATRLYAKADWIVFTETVLGTVIGFLVGLASGFMLPNERFVRVLGVPIPGILLMAIASGMIGCVIGGVTGNHKAFMLRLHAQTALCQAQIEENTRTGAARMTG